MTCVIAAGVAKGRYNLTEGPSVTLSSTYKYGNYPVFLTATTGIVIYTDNSTGCYARHFSVGDSSITLGTETLVSPSSTNINSVGGCFIDTDKILVTYSVQPVSGSWQNYAVVVSNSGGTLTAGTRAELARGNAQEFGTMGAVKLSTTKLITKHDGAEICTISGTTVTPASAASINDTSDIKAFDGTYALSLYDPPSTSGLAVSLLTISGTSISEGSGTTITSTNAQNGTISLSNLSSTKQVAIWCEAGTAPKARVVSLSGTTLSVGSTYSGIMTGTPSYGGSVPLTNDTALVCMNGSTQLMSKVIKIDGTTVNSSVGAQLNITGTVTDYVTPCYLSPTLAVVGYLAGSAGKLMALRVS